MFKQTSKQMQHCTWWSEMRRHLWLFFSRFFKHTLHPSQWYILSLSGLRERKKLIVYRLEKYCIHFNHNVVALQTISAKSGAGQKKVNKNNQTRIPFYRTKERNLINPQKIEHDRGLWQLTGRFHIGHNDTDCCIRR